MKDLLRLTTLIFLTALITLSIYFWMANLNASHPRKIIYYEETPVEVWPTEDPNQGSTYSSWGYYPIMNVTYTGATVTPVTTIKPKENSNVRHY